MQTGLITYSNKSLNCFCYRVIKSNTVIDRNRLEYFMGRTGGCDAAAHTRRRDAVWSTVGPRPPRAHGGCRETGPLARTYRIYGQEYRWWYVWSLSSDTGNRIDLRSSHPWWGPGPAWAGLDALVDRAVVQRKLAAAALKA